MKKDQLADSVRNLKKLATVINEASDGAQGLLEHYEGELQETRIGIEVWAEVVERRTDWERFEATSDVVECGNRIGWCKVGDEWRFAYQWVTKPDDKDDDDAENWSPTDPPEPVLNGSRIIRLAAVSLIPKIVERLTVKAIEVAQAAERAAATVPSLTEWTEAVKGPDIPF